MTETDRREDMGGVTDINNPPGISWLRFTFAQPDCDVPVSTDELVECKGREPRRGDYFMAGVNLLAESPADVRPKILRYVKDLGDI